MLTPEIVQKLAGSKVLVWREHKDGSVTVVLERGPKMHFTAEAVAMVTPEATPEAEPVTNLVQPGAGPPAEPVTKARAVPEPPQARAKPGPARKK
jgi:hypothetical protein